MNQKDHLVSLSHTLVVDFFIPLSDINNLLQLLPRDILFCLAAKVI